MVNSVSYITFFPVILCMVSLLFVVTVHHLIGGMLFLILVVIIFQLFKACSSVQECTCVNKHMIFANGTKKV